MLVGDAFGQQRQLNDVARLPFVARVVDDRSAFPLNDIVNDAALTMLLAAAASRRDFLHGENKRLVAASLSGGMEIPLHEALRISLPGQFRLANDERAFRSERALPVSEG